MPSEGLKRDAIRAALLSNLDEELYGCPVSPETPIGDRCKAIADDTTEVTRLRGRLSSMQAAVANDAKYLLRRVAQLLPLDHAGVTSGVVDAVATLKGAAELDVVDGSPRLRALPLEAASAVHREQGRDVAALAARLEYVEKRLSRREVAFAASVSSLVPPGFEYDGVVVRGDRVVVSVSCAASFSVSSSALRSQLIGRLASRLARP